MPGSKVSRVKLKNNVVNVNTVFYDGCLYIYYSMSLMLIDPEFVIKAPTLPLLILRIAGPSAATI